MTIAGDPIEMELKTPKCDVHLVVQRDLKEIQSDLDKGEARMNDHGLRIRLMEQELAAAKEIIASQGNMINTVCKQLGELGGDIRSLVSILSTSYKEMLWKIIGGMGAIGLVLIGFVVWYIQHMANVLEATVK